MRRQGWRLVLIPTRIGGGLTSDRYMMLLLRNALNKKYMFTLITICLKHIGVAVLMTVTLGLETNILMLRNGNEVLTFLLSG